MNSTPANDGLKAAAKEVQEVLQTTPFDPRFPNQNQAR